MSIYLSDDMTEDELRDTAAEQRAETLVTALNARMREVGDAVKGMRRIS